MVELVRLVVAVALVGVGIEVEVVVEMGEIVGKEDAEFNAMTILWLLLL